MVMLTMYKAITKMANRAILAIMATIVMAIGNFSMAMRRIRLKSKKNSLVMLDSYQSDVLFRRYQKICDLVIFIAFLQCKNSKS